MSANIGLIYFVALRFTRRNPNVDFDDAVQDAAVALLRAAPFHDASRGKFSTFAIVSMRGPLGNRACREHGRRLPGIYSIHGPNCTLEIPARDREDAPGGDELELLGRAIARLSGTARRVLRARFGLGGAREMTLEEIGQRMGVTRERVRQVELAALAQLRGILTQHKPPQRSHGELTRGCGASRQNRMCSASHADIHEWRTSWTPRSTGFRLAGRSQTPPPAGGGRIAESRKGDLKCR